METQSLPMGGWGGGAAIQVCCAQEEGISVSGCEAAPDEHVNKKTLNKQNRLTCLHVLEGAEKRYCSATDNCRERESLNSREHARVPARERKDKGTLNPGAVSFFCRKCRRVRQNMR